MQMKQNQTSYKPEEAGTKYNQICVTGGGATPIPIFPRTLWRGINSANSIMAGGEINGIFIGQHIVPVVVNSVRRQVT